MNVIWPSDVPAEPSDLGRADRDPGGAASLLPGVYGQAALAPSSDRVCVCHGGGVPL